MVIIPRRAATKPPNRFLDEWFTLPLGFCDVSGFIIEPVLNGWMFMRRLVVDNEVQIKFLRGFPVDLF
jgi:hypothetical protein